MSKTTKSYRCEVLGQGLNAGKQQAVRALLTRWREVAVLIGREQWRFFYETGRFNARHYRAPTAVDRIGGAHRDMIRHKVVGLLESWVSNRQNEVRDLIQGAPLPADLKHRLHTINRLSAWYRPGPIAMRDGTAIGVDVRRLARRLFAQACRRHRRPDRSRINAIVDQRAVQLSNATAASAFRLWARLSTLERGQPIWVPLRKNAHHQRRRGQRVQVLSVLGRQHLQRFARLRAGPADPRRANPYFKELLADGDVNRQHPLEQSTVSTGFAG